MPFPRLRFVIKCLSISLYVKSNQLLLIIMASHYKFFPFPLVVLCGALAISATAQTIVLTEYFNYGDTNLDNGYGSWADTTNNITYSITDGPTSFGASGYQIDGTMNPNSGGGILSMSVTGTNVRGVQLAIPGGALSGEFWVSFLISPDYSTANVDRYSLFAFNSNTYNISNPQGPAFGLTNHTVDGREFVITNNTGTSVNTSGGVWADSNTWRLVLARVTVNASANDLIDIWTYANADPVPTTVSSLGAAQLSYSTVEWGDSVSNIWLGTRGSNARYDAIRISSGDGDVGLTEVLTGVPVPEPSTWFTTFGCAALLVTYLRSRHHRI